MIFIRVIKVFKHKMESKATKPHKNNKLTTLGNNFNLYIKELLKHNDPTLTISGVSLSIINNLIKVIIAKLTYVINIITIRINIKTLSPRDIQAAINLSFPLKLAKLATNIGYNAISHYKSFLDTEPAGIGPIQRKTRAGLIFNVTRIEKLLMIGISLNRKNKMSAVYMTAVVEYVCSEILKKSSDVTKLYNKARLTPRHIKLGISNNVELSFLYKDTIIGGGIHTDINAIPAYNLTKTKIEILTNI